MKRSILLALVIVSRLVMGQLSPGFHPLEGYALDDFSTEQEYSGLDWFHPVGPVVLPYDTSIHYRVFDEFKGWQDKDSCRPSSSPFYYSLNRDAVNKKGIVTITQPYGHKEPITLKFGNNATLDLSKNNAYVYLDIKNVSNYNSVLYIALLDIDGKELDAIGVSDTYQMYQDWVMKELQSGLRGQYYLDFNTQAYKAVYKDSVCSFLVPKEKDRSFKKDKVAGIRLMFVNYDFSLPYYDRYPLQDAAFELRTVRIGASVVADLAPPVNVSKKEIYPNPVKEVIYLSSEMKNVRLLDVLGNSVYYSPSTSQISVSQFPKGIYFLRSDSVSPTRLVIE